MSMEFVDTNLEVPAPDVTAVSHPRHISDGCHIDVTVAEKVCHLADEVARKRHDGRYDYLIVLDEWAVDDYDVSDSRLMFVGLVEDYSRKAYKCRGTFEIDTLPLTTDAPIEEQHVIDLLTWVDDDQCPLGTRFLPKTAVSFVGGFVGRGETDDAWP